MIASYIAAWTAFCLGHARSSAARRVVVVAGSDIGRLASYPGHNGLQSAEVSFQSSA